LEREGRENILLRQRASEGQVAENTEKWKESIQMEKKSYEPRLKVKFEKELVKILMKEFKYSSPMAAVKLKKIVINVGVSQGKENIQEVEQAKSDIALICGQMPQIRRAKKSISNFKLRKGMPIGVRVTLRGDRMYEFLDRFISLASPRIRDFQGFDERCFDGKGNLNLGIREQYIFPEINVEKSPRPRGMNISFVTDAGSDEKARILLEMLGIPFKRKKKQN